MSQPGENLTQMRTRQRSLGYPRDKVLKPNQLQIAGRRKGRRPVYQIHIRRGYRPVEVRQPVPRVLEHIRRQECGLLLLDEADVWEGDAAERRVGGFAHAQPPRTS